MAYLVAQEGSPSISALVQQLRTNSFTGLHRQVVNAMTNNETWFFRDLLPFEALRKEIIPALVARQNTERTLRIWSAACSAGQEPYTLAMMLKENFPELDQWRYSNPGDGYMHFSLEEGRTGKIFAARNESRIAGSAVSALLHASGNRVGDRERDTRQS
jgi:chemotaxis protein methyltransferase CheR